MITPLGHIPPHPIRIARCERVVEAIAASAQVHFTPRERPVAHARPAATFFSDAAPENPFTLGPVPFWRFLDRENALEAAATIRQKYTARATCEGPAHESLGRRLDMRA